MIINHNLAAMNTHRQLTGNTVSANKSLEKLSSGLRINRAGDDAAGLAISEKMRGQIRGLNQASRNSQDGISLIQTAEGALNETHSILQRMRELSVQSGNDTNTDQDRKNLQAEMDQLNKEIDRIRDTTQFNTKNLLDGAMGNKTSAVAQVQANAAVKGAGSSLSAADTLSTLTDVNGKNLGIQAGDEVIISYVTSNGKSVEQKFVVSAAANNTLDKIISVTGSNVVTLSAGKIVATASAAGFIGALNGLTITVKDSKGDIKQAASTALSSFNERTAAADNRANDGKVTFQIGANTNQYLQLGIEDLGTSALGVNGLKIETREQANIATKVIDAATQKVSAQRSALGAVQNRLEHTINNLGAASENLSAAESRIRDVDMAKEMMEFTRSNILTQASQAMLAQANQQPQGVLQLLR